MIKMTLLLQIALYCTSCITFNLFETVKRRKYAAISKDYIFVPFAVETMGPWGPEAKQFYKELSSRLIDASGDPRAGAYLGQQISLAIQRGTVTTLKSLQIHVPKAVLTGRDAELMCSYELEGAQLYSIRWYRNMIEFYRYVPKESPATKVFPVAEIKVDVAASDQNRVVLTEVDRTLTGEYQCEVSADAPLFHTDIKAAEMVVVEPPLISPNVTSDRMTYIGGDKIRANCSSPPSLPAANITWYVNEQMVPSFTANHVLNFSNGYASSLSTLELEAAVLSPVPTLMIRCEASIFDVWKSSSHTIVLRERSANPASALERSLTGAATGICLPTIIILLLQHFLQFLLENFTESSIR